MPSLPPKLFRKESAPASFAPRAPDKSRPDSTVRGYTSRWKRVAKSFLAQNPLCRTCEQSGRSVLASLVDHIVPVSEQGENDPLFYVSSNHQPLCRRCHARKTAQDKAAGLTR